MTSMETRGSGLKASLLVWPGAKSFYPSSAAEAALPAQHSAAESPQSQSREITFNDLPEKATFTNEIATVIYEKRPGFASYEWSGRRKVTNACSKVDVGGILKSTHYATRTLQPNPAELDDGVSRGRRLTMVNRADGSA